jgi:hypothetical protein
MNDELDDYIKKAAGIKTNGNPQAKTKITDAVKKARALGYDIPDEVADDFYDLTALESGRSHYLPDGKTVKTGVKTPDGDFAIGFSQVMGNTAKPYQQKGLDPYNETDNIVIGLNEFYNGDKKDTIARRLAYVGGPDSAALKEYRRTGTVPDRKLYSYLPNNKETYKSYVEQSGGYKPLDNYIKSGGTVDNPQNFAGIDDYIKQSTGQTALPESSVSSNEIQPNTLAELQQNKKDLENRLKTVKTAQERANVKRFIKRRFRSNQRRIRNP